jgi:hypothetical protein
MRYAKDGHKFYSVITPSVAIEYELPISELAWSEEDERKWEVLADTARDHGVCVQANSYALL